jgi:hypothetical protein
VAWCAPHSRRRVAEGGPRAPGSQQVNVCSRLLWNWEREDKQTGSKTGRAGTGFCGTLLRDMMPTAQQPAKQRGQRPRAKAPPSACLLACLSEIWRTEDKADRLKQGACARALLPHSSVGNVTHRTAAGASLRSACARPALALSPFSAIGCGIERTLEIFRAIRDTRVHATVRAGPGEDRWGVKEARTWPLTEIIPSSYACRCVCVYV